MIETRADISIGAVDASAPMLFKVVSASTHTFYNFFLLDPAKGKNGVKNRTCTQKKSFQAPILSNS